MTTGNYSGSSMAAPPGGDLSTSSEAGDSAGAKEQAKEQAAQVAGTAAGEGRQVAGTAADEARQVAGAAQGEAGRVASEASAQVRGLVSEATAQVEDHSRTQLGRLAETLRSWGEDFERMASQGEGPATGLAREAADRARGFAAHLEGREPRDLVEDVRGFARRRPGVFLAGSLVAGVLAGRLTRGAKAARDGSDEHSSQGPAGGEPYPSPSQGLAAQSRPVSQDGFVYDDVAGTSTEPDVDRTGLPNPAASVAGDTTYATGDATGLPGGRA